MSCLSLTKKSCSNVGKIGYGTVSEALAYKLPFVFVRRDYFNEEPFLRNMLEVETFWPSPYVKTNLKLCVVIKYLAWDSVLCSLLFHHKKALSMWHWDDTEGFTYWALETLSSTCYHTSTLLWWSHKWWRGNSSLCSGIIF